MNMKLSKAAAIIAWIIGGMAVFAGGRVLLGTLPNYYVIDWLPIYNFIVGLVTVLVTAVLIWRNSRYALPVAVTTFTAHGLVLLVLLTAFRGVVAQDSLVAMVVRSVTWTIILVLVFGDANKAAGTRHKKGRFVDDSYATMSNCLLWSPIIIGSSDCLKIDGNHLGCSG